MPSPANGDPAIGVGVICSTSEEARQFVDQRSHAVARAEGPMPSLVNGDAAVGVICNTSEEARQFVDLRSHGAAPDQAVQALNANPCGDRLCS
jgi:hypothetical protein